MEHEQMPNYTVNDLVTILTGTKDQKLCRVVSISPTQTKVKLLESPFVCYETAHFRIKKYTPLSLSNL